MEPRRESNDSQLPVEERRLRLDEQRFLLDNSFARKWLPTLATLMVGLIAAMFSYVQHGGADDSNRLESLAAIAGVQDALASARQSRQAPPANFIPSDFTIYVQYPDGDQVTALKTQSLLVSLGYRVPGIQQIAKAPSRLQVRYYRPDQRSYAGDLATELGKELNLPTGPDNAILVQSSKELPSGILEVWLPR